MLRALWELSLIKNPTNRVANIMKTNGCGTFPKFSKNKIKLSLNGNRWRSLWENQLFFYTNAFPITVIWIRWPFVFVRYI